MEAFEQTGISDFELLRSENFDIDFGSRVIGGAVPSSSGRKWVFANPGRKGVAKKEKNKIGNKQKKGGKG
jgi:hypothetical protein